MLVAPVTLFQEDHGRRTGTEIVTCCVPADGTMQDLQESIEARLGPHCTVTGLSYRGCKPGLSSPLQDCAVSKHFAPRFQITYHKPSSSGDNMKIFVKVCCC